MSAEAKTRYNDFDTFLAEVVTKAQERIDELKRQYGMDNVQVVAIIITILAKAGYVALVMIATLCALGLMAFPAVLVGFVSSPIGIALLAIFGGALISSMWTLRRNRKVVFAVKEVGDKVKAPHAFLVKTKADHAKFDRLFEEAVVALLVTPKEFYGNRAIWTGAEVAQKYATSFSRDPQ